MPNPASPSEKQDPLKDAKDIVGHLHDELKEHPGLADNKVLKTLNNEAVLWDIQQALAAKKERGESNCKIQLEHDLSRLITLDFSKDQAKPLLTSFGRNLRSALGILRYNVGNSLESRLHTEHAEFEKPASPGFEKLVSEINDSKDEKETKVGDEKIEKEVKNIETAKNNNFDTARAIVAHLENLSNPIPGLTKEQINAALNKDIILQQIQAALESSFYKNNEPSLKADFEILMRSFKKNLKIWNFLGNELKEAFDVLNRQRLDGLKAIESKKTAEENNKMLQYPEAIVTSVLQQLEKTEGLDSKIISSEFTKNQQILKDITYQLDYVYYKDRKALIKDFVSIVKEGKYADSLSPNDPPGPIQAGDKSDPRWTLLKQKNQALCEVLLNLHQKVNEAKQAKANKISREKEEADRLAKSIFDVPRESKEEKEKEKEKEKIKAIIVAVAKELDTTEKGQEAIIKAFDEEAIYSEISSSLFLSYDNNIPKLQADLISLIKSGDFATTAKDRDPISDAQYEKLFEKILQNKNFIVRAKELHEKIKNVEADKKAEEKSKQEAKKMEEPNPIVEKILETLMKQLSESTGLPKGDLQPIMKYFDDKELPGISADMVTELNTTYQNNIESFAEYLVSLISKFNETSPQSLSNDPRWTKMSDPLKAAVFNSHIIVEKAHEENRCVARTIKNVNNFLGPGENIEAIISKEQIERRIYTEKVIKRKHITYHRTTSEAAQIVENQIIAAIKKPPTYGWLSEKHYISKIEKLHEAYQEKLRKAEEKAKKTPPQTVTHQKRTVDPGSIVAEIAKELKAKGLGDEKEIIAVFNHKDIHTQIINGAAEEYKDDKSFITDVVSLVIYGTYASKDFFGAEPGTITTDPRFLVLGSELQDVIKGLHQKVQAEKDKVKQEEKRGKENKEEISRSDNPELGSATEMLKTNMVQAVDQVHVALSEIKNDAKQIAKEGTVLIKTIPAPETIILKNAIEETVLIENYFENAVQKLEKAEQNELKALQDAKSATEINNAATRLNEKLTTDIIPQIANAGLALTAAKSALEDAKYAPKPNPAWCATVNARPVSGTTAQEKAKSTEKILAAQGMMKDLLNTYERLHHLRHAAEGDHSAFLAIPEALKATNALIDAIHNQTKLEEKKSDGTTTPAGKIRREDVPLADDMVDMRSKFKQLANEMKPLTERKFENRTKERYFASRAHIGTRNDYDRWINYFKRNTHNPAASLVLTAGGLERYDASKENKEPNMLDIAANTNNYLKFHPPGILKNPHPDDFKRLETVFYEEKSLDNKTYGLGVIDLPMEVSDRGLFAKFLYSNEVNIPEKDFRNRTIYVPASEAKLQSLIFKNMDPVITKGDAETFMLKMRFPGCDPEKMAKKFMAFMEKERTVECKLAQKAYVGDAMYNPVNILGRTITAKMPHPALFNAARQVLDSINASDQKSVPLEYCENLQLMVAIKLLVDYYKAKGELKCEIKFDAEQFKLIAPTKEQTMIMREYAQIKTFDPFVISGLQTQYAPKEAIKNANDMCKKVSDYTPNPQNPKEIYVSATHNRLTK